MSLNNLKTLLTWKTAFIVICSIVVLLLVFQAGELIGYRKASFAFRGGDNYYRAFEPENRQPMFGDQFPGAHGAVGRIVKLDLPTFVVAGPDNMEKEVSIDNDTIVRRFRNTIKASDLKINDYVVVIGAPDDNSDPVIKARLIRLMPPPPKNNEASSTLKVPTSTKQNQN